MDQESWPVTPTPVSITKLIVKTTIIIEVLNSEPVFRRSFSYYVGYSNNISYDIFINWLLTVCNYYCTQMKEMLIHDHTIGKCSTQTYSYSTGSGILH